jgi:hypothetical protein
MRRLVDGKICEGDVIVCRVNGTSDLYVVATVSSGRLGELSVRGVSTTIGQGTALGRAYDERSHDQRVWLFDGAASGYVKTAVPPAEIGERTNRSGPIP